MSTSSTRRSAALIVLVNMCLGVVSHVNAREEPWRTVIPCGTSQYVVTSHCTASHDLLQLNTCRPGQQLSAGTRAITVPVGKRAADQPQLFATHWQCVNTEAETYLVLSFSSGRGRSANDESVGFYDSQLRRVTEQATVEAIHWRSGKSPSGYVKSIYPGDRE